jgi:chorismate synthase
MKNSYGSNITLTIFGESHGAAVGAVLDGMAAGCAVDEAFIAACMDKRRARGDGLSTARTEADAVRILSGAVGGHTTGTPLTLMIENQNTRSGDYAKTADLLRPGHADYTAYAKYHGMQDARGGGHFSGRITAGLVAAGAVLLAALEAAGITIETHIARCAGLSDTAFAQDDPALVARQVQTLRQKTEGFAVLDAAVEEPMKAAIRAAGAEGDSVGGVLETAILGLPAGVGEPFFDSVESALAHLAFSIPAVKGIEFGAGFGFADLRGSGANDAFRVDEGGRVVTATNRNAGVNGGITNGMPVLFRTAVKPTPSIYKTQQTVDYSARQNAELSIQGRHDPCIVPRAAIVQTAAAALAVADLLTARYGEAWMTRPATYRDDNREEH